MRRLRELSVLAAGGTLACLAGLPAGLPVGVTPTAAAATAPGITLSGVTAGGTYSGQVTLTATGDAGTGRHAAEVDFLVDGEIDDTEVCTDSPQVCTESWTWDSTGLSGTHTLQARLETDDDAVTPASAVIGVTVLSPPPTAVITSPASGAQVPAGLVAVTGLGTVDATQADSGSYALLLVDGDAADSQDCPHPTARSCPVTFRWDAGSLVGSHTLQMQLGTANGLTATSPPVPVVVHVGTKTHIAAVTPVPYGHQVQLTGEIDALGGTPLQHVPVVVTVRPGVGRVVRRTVTTDADGRWRLSWKPTSNATVVASITGSPAYGASHASTKVQVYRTGRCRTPPTVAAAARDTMTCSKLVPSLPKGTKVLLQRFSGGRWRTLLTARVRGRGFVLTFRLTTRGTTYLRLYLPPTKQFAWSASAPYQVSVR